MENWITPREWRSPIWRHLLLKVIYCKAQLQVARQKFKWLNRPFKETWHFIFFLEPMCQLPVQLKALSGGGTLSHPVCWQPGATAATWSICATEYNYWMREWMTNAKKHCDSASSLLSNASQLAPWVTTGRVHVNTDSCTLKRLSTPLDTC